MSVSEEVKPKFLFPIVPGNPSGWGPCDLPEQFKDVPYQPFSKADRVGKVGSYMYNVWWYDMTLTVKGIGRAVPSV